MATHDPAQQAANAAVTSESDLRLGPRPKEFDGGLHPATFKEGLIALKRNNPGVRPKKLVKTDAWMELKQQEQVIVDALTVEERELWELKGALFELKELQTGPRPQRKEGRLLAWLHKKEQRRLWVP
jgi:hypothetical protein